MDIPGVLLPIVAVNVLAWLSPGPNMLAVMSASLSHGRRLGVITGLGMALAALIWAALAMAGVTALFDIFPHLVLLLRVTGAAYLFWLGVKLLRSGLRDAPLAPQPMPPASARRAFLSGFTISMTNPKAALFFGSILTTFVPPDAPPGLLISVVLLCGLLAAVLHSLTATLFSTHAAAILFARARCQINLCLGAALCVLGGAVAADALRRA